MGKFNVYKEYENKIYSIKDSSALKQEEINDLFSYLLSVLPNKGKLYRYRNINDNTIDELANKYLWHSTADKLNDHTDGAFLINVEDEMRQIIDFLSVPKNLKSFIKWLILSDSKFCKKLNPETIDECYGYITCTKKLQSIKYDKLVRDKKATKQQVEELKSIFNNHAIDYKKAAELLITKFYEVGNKMQSRIRICSLTTDYNQDSMWAYYTNNQGICVEYDFNKIPFEYKKKVCFDLLKVKYGTRKRFSCVKFLKLLIERGKDIENTYQKSIVEQLGVKSEGWKSENEWRLITSMTNCKDGKVYYDIISAIYIDYSVIKRNKTKEIIKLAQVNDWKIYYRYYNELQSKYIYADINEIKRIKKENKKWIDPKSVLNKI